MVDYGGAAGAYGKIGVSAAQIVAQRKAKLARQALKRAAGNGPTMPVFEKSDTTGGDTDYPDTNKYGVLDPNNKYVGAGWGTPNYIRKAHNADGSVARQPIPTLPGETNKEARLRLRELRQGINNTIKAPEGSTYNEFFGRNQGLNIEAAGATVSAFLPGSGMTARGSLGALGRNASKVNAYGAQGIYSAPTYSALGGKLGTGAAVVLAGSEAKDAVESAFKGHGTSEARDAAHENSMEQAASNQMNQPAKPSTTSGAQQVWSDFYRTPAKPSTTSGASNTGSTSSGRNTGSTSKPRGPIVSQSDTQWVKETGKKGYVALKSDLTKAYTGRVRLTAAGTTRIASGSKKDVAPMGVADYRKGVNKRGYGPNQRVAVTGGSLDGPYARKKNM